MILQNETEYQNTLERLNELKRNLGASAYADAENLDIIRFLEDKVIDYEKRAGKLISISRTPLLLTKDEYRESLAMVERWKSQLNQTVDIAKKQELESCIVRVETHLREYEKRTRQT
jgi:hypothetical protein